MTVFTSIAVAVVLLAGPGSPDPQVERACELVQRVHFGYVEVKYEGEAIRLPAVLPALRGLRAVDAFWSSSSPTAERQADRLMSINEGRSNNPKVTLRKVKVWCRDYSN